MTLEEVVRSITPADQNAAAQAKARWDSIAKPLGSLGALESAVIRMAAITGTPNVDISKRAVVVMCADNGVVADGVTQTGQEVTAIVAENMSTGDTSVCAMGRAAGVEIVPVDIGVATPLHGQRILQKNIRRKYWMKWYDQHVDMQDPVRLFWWLSDYGTSSTRCIGAFALLILAACVIYFFITGAAIADIPQLFADTILATFGFGSLFDQLTGPIRLLLAAHVLFGYFLLAVLITRFAVMFQSLTP